MYITTVIDVYVYGSMAVAAALIVVFSFCVTPKTNEMVD
jgi:hypothetical protein